MLMVISSANWMKKKLIRSVKKTVNSFFQHEYTILELPSENCFWSVVKVLNLTSLKKMYDKVLKGRKNLDEFWKKIILNVLYWEYNM